MLPRLVESLHKGGMTFHSCRVTDVHDSHVATCTSYVTDIEEIVACEALLGDFRLFPLVAVVNCDDSAGRSVLGRDLCSFVASYDDIMVIVPSMDLELLIVRRFVVDEQSVRHDVGFGCWWFGRKFELSISMNHEGHRSPIYAGLSLVNQRG